METERTERQDTSLPIVAVAALVVGVVGTVAASIRDENIGILIVRYALVGLVYLGVAFALRRTLRAPLPLLFAVFALSWYITNLADTHVSFLVGINTWLQDLYRVVFAHIVLAYPTGRLSWRPARIVVIVGYVAVVVGGLLRALTYQPYEFQSCECPRNAFAVFSNESTYNKIDDIYSLVGFLLAIAVLVLIVVLLTRWRAIGAGVTATPIWIALFATIAIIVSAAIRDQTDLSRNGLIVWLWVEGAALIATALGFLAARRNTPALERS